MKMPFAVSALILAIGCIGAPAMAQSTATTQASQAQPDNTKVNKADKKDARSTPQAQSNAKPDRELAAAVRKAIVDDKSLSTYAHNVKVIAQDGSVTLRGPVRSGEEKTKVAELAKQVPNVQTVDNRVTVKPSK